MEYTILEYINKSSICKYFFIFYIIVMHIIFSSFNFQNNYLTKVKYFEFMILRYIYIFFFWRQKVILLRYILIVGCRD